MKHNILYDIIATLAVLLIYSCIDGNEFGGNGNYKPYLNYEYSNYEISVSINQAEISVAEAQAKAYALTKEISAAQASAGENATVIQAADGTIITTYPDGSRLQVEVDISFSYEIDGVSYASIEDAQAALQKRQPDTTALLYVTLIQTTTAIMINADGTKGENPQIREDARKMTSNIIIPPIGQTKTNIIQIPTSFDDSTTPQTAEVVITVLNNN